MLPRRLRLSRREFESAARGGGLMRASSPHFAISYGPSDDRGGAGVVVTKKVEKSSVKRHTLKRRIRAAILPHLTRGQVVIVYARPGSESLPYESIESELRELIGRTRP